MSWQGQDAASGRDVGSSSTTAATPGSSHPASASASATTPATSLTTATVSVEDEAGPPQPAPSPTYAASPRVAGSPTSVDRWSSGRGYGSTASTGSPPPEGTAWAEGDEGPKEYRWQGGWGARRRGYDHPLAYEEEEEGERRQGQIAYAYLAEKGAEERRSKRRLQTRSSVLLPSLQEWERRFFELVAAGDVGPVKSFLREHRNFNINCVDYQGLTALHIAVRAGDEEMTALLLSTEGIDPGDCALHSAQAGNTRLLEMLLEHARGSGAEREFAGCAGSPDFPDGTTPLLLAGQEGHYDAIALLLARGHELQRPHPPSCACAECMEEHKRADQLAAGARRLGLYRAWVNPAFLCHSSDDPVLEAFRLCSELRSWAKAMPQLRKAFTDLSMDARQFAADLLGCCRTSHEVEVLLRRRAGGDFAGHLPFPRLMLAVDLVQKEFVAHANAQQVLEAQWTGNWATWRSYSSVIKALYVFPRAFMLPFIAVVCLFAPRSSLGKHYALPVNKYLSHTASYMIFLGLVFVESNMDKKLQKRGPPDSGLEPVIIVFVAGHMWSSLRLCFIQGPRRFFSVQSNWFEAMTQLLFVSAFMFWGAAALDVAANDQEELERKYWHALDPTLVAEGLLALATILAFSRVLHFLQFSFHLGPLQVSLGKMIKDIAKFVVIFAIVMLSFAAGLSRLYEYYDGMIQHDSSGGSTAQVSSFVSFTSTLVTLFWAIFCMSPVEAGDVVIEELPKEGEEESIINHHYFTAGVGHLCFALFEVFSVIVLLNMLVATICNTFQKVTDNVDVEWTFGRTEIYLVYMAQTILPPPLNMLPTAGGLGALVRWCSLLKGGGGGDKGGKEDEEKEDAKGKKKKKKKGGEAKGGVEGGGGGGGERRGRARCSLAHCCFVEEPPPDEEEQRDYAAVLAQLAQRYFRERDAAAEAAASPELDSLRKEVTNLTYALSYALEPDPRGRSPGAAVSPNLLSPHK